jgi:hypothetical protein
MKEMYLSKAKKDPKLWKHCFLIVLLVRFFNPTSSVDVLGCGLSTLTIAIIARSFLLLAKEN